MLYFTRICYFFTGLLLFACVNTFALTASFTADHVTGCAPLVVHFTNLSTGATSYSWNFGSSTPVTLTSPSWTFASPGTYPVTLTASDGTSTATFTDTIRVYDTPSVYFRADTAVCVGATVHFYDSSILRTPGSGSYYWQLAPGITSTSQNPTYNYSSSGFYTITLTTTNSEGCQSVGRKTNYVHVYDPPSAGFYASTTLLCTSSGTISFTSTPTGGPSPYTYYWDFGDGGHSTGANPTHTYSGYGDYNVALVVTSAAGCKDTILQNNYITLTHEVASFTVAPSPVCQNSYLTVTNTSSPPPTSTTWYFGDGTTSSPNPAIHSYSSSGSDTIILVSTHGSCTDTAKQIMIVNPQPSVSLTASPLDPCPATTTINFSSHTTSTISSYTWDFGDGATSASANPSHTYTDNGIYDIKLIAKNTFGCIDSTDSVAYVKIYPLILNIFGNNQITSTGGCIPLAMHFYFRDYYVLPPSYTPTPYPYAVSSVHWDFGDGGTSTADSPTHTYTAYGTYQVILNINTANGCSKADTFTVHAGTPPHAAFSATPTTACIDELVTFTNTSDSATDYFWDFGDATSSPIANPTHKYVDSGSFTVTLIAYNNGCPDTAKKIHYINVNIPRADFLYYYSCDTPKKINFVNKSIGGTSFSWYFGDATSSSSFSPSHVYASTGTYNVMLVAYDSTTGCHDTAKQAITVYNPLASLTAGDTVVCLHTAVLFTSTLTGGVPVKYGWKYDNSASYYYPDTTSSMTFTYSTTGYHAVKVYITDSRGCIDTFSRYHYVAVAKPDVSFSAMPTKGCAPLTVYFTDNSTDISGVSVNSRSWDFGDGVYHSVASATTSHYYPGAGTYYVFLKATDNVGCTDSLTKPAYIQVNKPVANFSTSASNACVEQPILFYNSSMGGGLTFHWDFGDGHISTDNFPSHAYSSVGTYTVRLVVTDTLGCKDSMTKLSYIHIVAKPTAAFTVDDSMRICSPLIVHFTAHAIGAVRYYWDFGDPTATTGSGSTTSWTYINPGDYTVMLVVTNSTGCTDTAYHHVRVLGYAGILSYNPLTGCAPLKVNFKANISGVPDLIYDYGDGVTYRTSSYTTSHTYTSVGPFVPKVILTDDSGCSSESIGLDTIRVDGIYPGFYYVPYPACDSGTFTFIDTSTGAYSIITSRTWIFDDGTTSGSIITDHSYGHPGTYAITLIGSTNTGCTDTFNSGITVYPLPTIDAGPDTIVCVGDAAILMPSGGVTYVWSPTGTLSCDTCNNPEAKPNTKTVYTVLGIDAHGCTNTDTTTVFTKTKTTSIAHGSGEICDGVSIKLTDSAGKYSTYTWIPPYNLDDDHSPNPIANPDTSVMYMVIAKQGSCVPDTQYINVIVHPKPTVDAGPDETIIAGDTYQLDGIGTNISKYAWYPAESLSCDSCENPIAAPKKTTQYTVVVYTDFDCQDSDKVTIHVVCKSSQVFMPNTFTPNGDGENDIFYPRGKGLQIIKSFRIYNRWGQLMFEKQDINANEKQNGWDGTFKGTPLNPDVFVYVVDAICDTGEPVTWKGDISLIR